MKKKFYLILILFFYSATSLSSLQNLCKESLSKTVVCSNCSLDEWAKKVWSMKEFPIENSSLPNQKEYEAKILTKNEFFNTLENCVKTIKKEYSNDILWLNRSLASLHPNIFNINRSNFIFQPFAQRLIVKADSSVIFFGDLHGSAHSLLRDLIKLKDLKVLNSNFKILKNNFYIAFLGDFVDRGIYGVEVMQTLFRLKIANPKNVFIIRGNHEDYYLAKVFKERYENKEEEKDRAPSFLTELKLKFNTTDNEDIKLYKFFDILPCVLYLGSVNSKKQKDYFHCCHGGLEFGYNPFEFLNSCDEKKYHLIEKYNRKDNYEKLPKKYKNMLKRNFGDKVMKYEIQNMKLEEPIYKIPGTENLTYDGFLWADFYADPKKEIGRRPGKYPSWEYGKSFTSELLRQSSSKNIVLRAIIRAHQHNNRTGGPFLDQLCCSKGIYNVWQDYSLLTLVSSPNSKLEETGQMCFTYDSFLMLEFHKNNYNFKHYYQDSSIKPLKWHVKDNIVKH